MNRRVLALLFVLVLLPAPTTSVHTEPDDPLEPREVPDRPETPEELEGTPFVDEDNPFVERHRKATQDEAQDGLQSLYDAVTPTARPALEAAPQAAITLFRDGVKDDPRFGALEDWLGHGGWDEQDEHAYDGDWAIAIGDGEGYPTSTTGTVAALVTPELDLRTGVHVDGQLGEVLPDGDEQDLGGLATVEYETPGHDHDGYVRVSEDNTPASVDETVPVPATDTRQATAVTNDPSFMLAYWARHNLGRGADGLQVWVMHGAQRPEAKDLFDCIKDCTRVEPEPLEGASPEWDEVSSFTSGDAYTGAADWSQHYIDLSPWAQERVWVVFMLRTAPNPQGADYFEEGVFFEHEDFFGFQFDEVRLRGTPGAPNLQLRELVAPTDSYDTAAEIPVRTFIRNTGPITLGASTDIAITDPAHGGLGPLDPAKYTRSLDTVVLRPGEVHPILEPFPALGEDRTDLRAAVTIEPNLAVSHLGPFMTPDSSAARRPVQEEYEEFVGPLLPEVFDRAREATPTEHGPVHEAGRVADENVDGITITEGGYENLDAVDDEVVPVTGHPREHVDRADAANQGPTPVPVPDDEVEPGRDARPQDDQQVSFFDVERVRLITLSEPKLTEPWVDLEEPLGFSVVVRNEGTIPEQVTVLPTVLDVDDGNADATLDLLGNDLERTTTLAPAEEDTLSWDLDTSLKGHYKVYVRTSDFPDYHPRIDVPAADPIVLEFTETVPVIDGDPSDDAWNGAVEESLKFVPEDGSDIDVQAVFLNTATDLYVRLSIPDPTPDEEADDHHDVLELYFDDHGDLHLEDGEDALRIGPTDASGVPAVTDLEYDADAQAWVPGDAAGATVRTYDAGGARYVVELRRPLDGNELGGLKAEAGDRLGLVARLLSSTDGGDATTHVHPADASIQDDPAGDPLDQSLDDETRRWAALELAPEVKRVGGYAVSVVFGVGTGAGPILHYDFGKECPADWKVIQQGPSIEFPTGSGNVVGHDTWQCGYYPPEGRNLYFVGLKSNGNLCGTGECMPYAGGDGDYVTQYYQKEAVIETDDIFIDAKDPYLVLRHQYAMPVQFSDEILGRQPNPSGQISINGIAYVTAHAGGETYYLTPGVGDDPDTRHYDTETTVGIRDLRHGPSGRDFADVQNAGLGNGGQAYCRDVENLGTIVSGPRRAPNCGWWHPVGGQNVVHIPGSYRPVGDDYPIGEVFHGSPWKIDRIPLTGTHWNIVDGVGERESPHEIDLVGQHVKFQFHYVLSSENGFQSIDPNLNPSKDYGWRISDIALMDGISAVSDLAVLEANLATPYDAESIGIGAGPGADVPVNMTIGNVGIMPMESATAMVDCIDSDTGIPVGHGTAHLERLDPGQTIEVQVACPIPIGVTGGRIRIEARVEAGVPDDAPFNDRIQIDGLYEVTPTKDLAVDVQATPTTSSTGFRRSLLVDMHNHGNVPISDFYIQIQINHGAANGPIRTWKINSTILVGETLRLDPTVDTTPSLLSTDLRYNPLNPGTYTVIITGDMGDDKDNQNNRAAAQFHAVNTIYEEGFDGNPHFDIPGLVSGGPHMEGEILQMTQLDGNSILRAGDGEVIPAESEGQYVLPPIDLTSADGATLVLRHAYELETGFDAARVEASTDGENWAPLIPLPTRENPLGYPDEALVGDNPLLGNLPEARGAAFTGRSADDPTADEDGFVSTEFDLARFEDLQATRRFVDFPLDELANTGTNPIEGVDATRYYTDDSWTKSTPAEGWLIDNVTINGPRPHSGQTMWWSNTWGEFTQETVPQNVDTRLSIPLDLTGLSDDRGAVFSFWDWRAGWKDTDLQGTRVGSGGIFELHATQHAAAGRLEPRVVETAEDGWTRREVDVSSFVGNTVVLEFHYQSSRSLANEGSRNNAGWFLDDIFVHAYTLAGGERTNLLRIFHEDLENRTAEGCQGAGPFTVTKDSDADTLCWELRGRGLERPGAWHIEKVPGMDGRSVPAWRIATDDPTGYPNLLDSRLITPPVDLRGVVGQEARLQFDHRYDFEADEQMALLRAIDGGVVEFQVFDEATGTYGPWSQLLDRSVGRVVLATVGTGAYPSLQVDGLDVETSGYTSIYTRGIMYGPGNRPYPGGLGDPFGSYPGFCTGCRSGPSVVTVHPVGYAFSGQQEDWTTQTFDVSELVGKKVRFAFHAWSNPLDFQEGNLDKPRIGWDITNVAVEGTVFDGKPVHLRLRAATDGSVLDGYWTIDEFVLSGAIQRRNLALSELEGTLRFPEATGIEFPLDVVNLGTQPRTGIALGVRAVRQDTGALMDVELEHPDGTDIPATEVRDPQPGETVSGPIVLTDVGSGGDKTTWTVRVPDAQKGQHISIQARILEDRGTDKIENGQLIHFADYALPRDPNLANTRHAWEAVVDDTPVLSFETQTGGMPLRVEGAGPGSMGDVTVHGLLGNAGAADNTFTMDWNLEPASGTATPVPDGSTTVPKGGTTAVSLQLTDLEPGTYRVTATVPGGPSASIEFPVGRTENLWVEPFDATLSSTWEVDGNTDDMSGARRQGFQNVQWRVGTDDDKMDGLLYWGTHPLSTSGYCDHLGCGSDTPGVLATATTPVLDLSKALNGQATLTLDHSFFFGQHDGGRVSVAVMDENGNPLPCDGRAWMPLEPRSGAVHDGMTRSGQFGGVARLNPLTDRQPVFQGPQGATSQPVQTTYDLLGRVWCEGGSLDGSTQEVPLEDATVRLRFEVGVRDLPQPRRPGWQIDKVALSSGGVALGPTTDGAVRVVEMLRNAPKRIPFEVENLGLADDEYELEVTFQDDPNSVALEDATIALAGGARGLVWVEIRTPEDLPVGSHTLTLEAVSVHDPDTTASLTTLLTILPKDKPDLAVTIKPEAGYEQDSIGVVPLRIDNLGSVDSKKTLVRLEAKPEGGTYQTVETLEVDSICSHEVCGPTNALDVVNAHWQVPSTTGTYTLRATVDPKQHLLDLKPENNVFEVDVQVVPLQLPDLVVTGLEVTGADGRFLDDNSIVTVKATVRNDGQVAAQGATVRILAGSVTLTTAPLPVLVPGAEFVVEATQVVGGSSDTLDIIALVTGSNEVRTDNNEQVRTFQIRTHDVRIVVRDGLAARAGGLSSMPVQVQNLGNSLERLTLVATGPEGWGVRVATPELIVPPEGSLTGLVILEVPEGTTAGQRLLPVSLKANDLTVASTLVPVDVVEALEPASLSYDTASLSSGDGVLEAVVTSKSNVAQTLRITDNLGWLQETLFELGPLATQTVEVPLRIPTETPPGTYDDRIHVAPLDATWERSVDQTWTVHTTLAMDAAWTNVQSLDAPGNGTRALSLRLALENLGNVATAVNAEARSAEGTRVAAVTPVVLEPLEAHAADVLVYVDERLATPEGELLLTLTGGGENQTLALALPDLRQQPDLVVVSASVDDSRPRSGQPTTVRALLRNEGTAPSRLSVAHLYVDGILVAVADLPSLAVGEEAGVVFDWVPVRGGPNHVVVLADGGRQLLELHKDNNGHAMEVGVDETDLVADVFRGAPAPAASLLLLALALLALRRRRT